MVTGGRRYSINHSILTYVLASGILIFCVYDAIRLVFQKGGLKNLYMMSAGAILYLVIKMSSTGVLDTGTGVSFVDINKKFEKD